MDALGMLSIYTEDESALGTYDLELRVATTRFPGDLEVEFRPFTVTIAPCVSIESKGFINVGSFEYTIGDPITELFFAEARNPSCPFSTFSVLVKGQSGLPEGLTSVFDETTKQTTLSFFTEDSARDGEEI